MARTISYENFEQIFVFDDIALDPAIVDIFEIDEEWFAIYDYDKMLEILIEQGEMSIDEAEKFIEDISYEDGPVILFDAS